MNFSRRIFFILVPGLMAGASLCSAGMQSIVCKAGVTVTEIYSGISDVDTATNYPSASASATANGVSGSSSISVQGMDGRTFNYHFDISRFVTAFKSPSVAYDTVDTSNRVVMKVLSTNDISLNYSWSFGRSGDCFGMPIVMLRTPSTSRGIFDPNGGALTGSGSLTLFGNSFTQLVEITAGASIYGGSPSVDDADNFNGTVTLDFDFPPEAAAVTNIALQGQDLVLDLSATSLGQTNTIRYTTNLTAAGWTVLTNTVSDGSSRSVTIPVAGPDAVRIIQCTAPAP